MGEHTIGYVTCKICGRDFKLAAEDHYVAKERRKTGIVGALSGEEPRLFDAFDCPHCNCQNLISIRERNYCPCDYGICDECDNPEEESEDDG